MIAFGSSITRPDVYHACAEPGIRRAAEPGSVVFDLPAIGSISRSYNALLDRAAGLDDLEALVLVHQDAEIVSAELCSTIRATLADPDVGVIGCAGAIGVRSIAWWEGSVTLSSFVNRYEELGGGDLQAFSWDWDDAPAYARTGEVETLDGFVLVLSPWAVRDVRFDETLGAFHGYDLDFCLQVREAGRKVVTADFRAIHHRPLEMVPDLDEWIDAHIRVAEKWDGRMPGIGHAEGSWRERALRAEAERDAARSMAHSTELEIEARKAMLERMLAETRGSISWRITAPLRLFKQGAPAERTRLRAR
jgi:glycosyl transferase family 2